MTPATTSTATQEAIRWLNSWRLSFNPAAAASTDTGSTAGSAVEAPGGGEAKAGGKSDVAVDAACATSSTSHNASDELSDKQVPVHDARQQRSGMVHQHVRLGPAALERLAKIKRQRHGGASAPKEVCISASAESMWVRAFDKARGVPYYYHRETYESRWLPPAAAAAACPKAAATVASSRSMMPMRKAGARGGTTAVLTPVVDATNANPLIVTPASCEETVEV